MNAPLPDWERPTTILCRRVRDIFRRGAFFASQASWARDPNPIAALGRIARVGGMSQQDVDACLKNSAIEDAVVKERLEAEKDFGVSATPTLIIGGDKISGGVTIEQFRALVARKLGKS